MGGDRMLQNAPRSWLLGPESPKTEIKKCKRCYKPLPESYDKWKNFHDECYTKCKLCNKELPNELLGKAFHEECWKRIKRKD